MLPQLSRHEISLSSVIHLLQCGLALRNSVYLNRVQLLQRGPLWPASPLESSINKDSFDPAAHPLAVLRDPLQRADATLQERSAETIMATQTRKNFAAFFPCNASIWQPVVQSPGGQLSSL